MKQIQLHTCANGMRIVTESIPNVKTVALNWGVPAGVATNKYDGASVLLTELIQRGAGQQDAKEYSNALSALGSKHYYTCGISYIRLTSTVLSTRFLEVFPILRNSFLEPKLLESEFGAVKRLCLQSIQSLGDNPSQIASIALNEAHLPKPFNRSGYGCQSDIEHLTPSMLQKVWKETFVPDGSILTVAGDLQHGKVVELVEQHTNKWFGKRNIIKEQSAASREQRHIEHNSSQVHIAIGFDGPNATDENTLLESIAMSIFGGATSGRLFTEVRQKRSLCYSVSAGYSPSKERSMVRIYAGTTPERANETISVCLKQLHRLKDGITQEEFTRSVTRMKSKIVMQSESTAARAGALWNDLYARNYTRSVQECLQQFEGITYERVNQWLKQREFGAITLATVGPNNIQFDYETLTGPDY